MKFDYFAGEQRSREWFEIRLGKPTSSRLGDWLAVSKRDGSPLKVRKDYEKELMFERTFGVPFERFTTQAMQEGIDYEGFAREQYSKITGSNAVEVGCWYNDYFVASPDGGVDDVGLLEIKWLKDSNWTEVLETKAPLDNHHDQIQGQLFASDRKWCDYVAGNLNTKKLIIVRVERNEDRIKEIEESLKVKLSVKPFSLEGVHDFQVELPEPEAEQSDNINELGF